MVAPGAGGRLRQPADGGQTDDGRTVDGRSVGRRLLTHTTHAIASCPGASRDQDQQRSNAHNNWALLGKRRSIRRRQQRALISLRRYITFAYVSAFMSFLLRIIAVS